MHGACRQFFDAAEACVEQGEGDASSGVTSHDGVLPVGWRKTVNRAGVVQVNGSR